RGPCRASRGRGPARSGSRAARRVTCRRRPRRFLIQIRNCSQRLLSPRQSSPFDASQVLLYRLDSMTNPARSASKSDRTRQRILDAAALAFQPRGYASVTLKDIAALADLQAGSLYYHFDTKEELVEAVLEAGVHGAITATREAVHALGPGADPLARLRAAI